MVDDIIDAEIPCLQQLLEIHRFYGASVVALMEVDGPEISSYGVVDADQRHVVVDRAQDALAQRLLVAEVVQHDGHQLLELELAADEQDKVMPTRVHAIVLASKLHKPTLRALAYARATRPDVLDQYRDRFRYILVDEYQDTNLVQYLWLRLLAQGHKNICCVGDDDQCLAAGTLVRVPLGRHRNPPARLVALSRPGEEAKLVVLVGSHLGENVFTSQITSRSWSSSRPAIRSSSLRMPR